MRWSLVVSGMIGAAMLALGSDLVVPMSATVSGLCDLGGIASAIAFIGLAEGE